MNVILEIIKGLLQLKANPLHKCGDDKISPLISALLDDKFDVATAMLEVLKINDELSEDDKRTIKEELEQQKEAIADNCDSNLDDFLISHGIGNKAASHEVIDIEAKDSSEEHREVIPAAAVAHE